MDEYDELDDQGNPRNSNAKNKEDPTSAQTHGSNPKEKDHKKKRHGKMRRKSRGEDRNKAQELQSTAIDNSIPAFRVVGDKLTDDNTNGKHCDIYLYLQ